MLTIGKCQIHRYPILGRGGQFFLLKILLNLQHGWKYACTGHQVWRACSDTDNYSIPKTPPPPRAAPAPRLGTAGGAVDEDTTLISIEELPAAGVGANDDIGVIVNGVSGSFMMSTYCTGKIPCRPPWRPSYQFSSMRRITCTTSPFLSESSTLVCALKLYLATAVPSFFRAIAVAVSSDVTICNEWNVAIIFRTMKV